MLYKTIDLCAGIGGIRRGFELTGGYANVAAAEIDELACRTYKHLYGDSPVNDITSNEFKSMLKGLHYDVLLAGFPCQSFSSVGLREGFESKTKGTIFFDIAGIIEKTTPKVVFLENVENLVNHDKGNTFRTIIETLENDLNYKIIGVTKQPDGILQYVPGSFIRNSKMFGIPQNRPRVYIIAFSREYFGEEADSLPNSTPKKGRKTIYSSLFDVLEKGEVDDSYFLSSGYLETLEKHIVRQREKGYGFGYRVVNSPEIENPIANTLLATGGSGRERNLILDRENGLIYAGKMVKRKYSPINNKYIRTMTPNEWGKLQGFIGYAFVEKDGIDRFSFPPEVSNLQKYKQFGNSVTIPVIEEMAKFILECIDSMTKDYTAIQKRLFAMYGNEHKVCSAIYQKLGSSLREKTINIYFDIVFYFKCDSKFRNIEVAEFLGISSARASQIITQLCSVHCLSRNADRTYSFTIT